MMTIWDSSHRNELLARFEKLTPDRRPAWGQMTCAQMIAHVADPMKAAMGETVVVPKPGPLLRATLDRFVASGEKTRPKPHPAFGDISHKAWGRLMYRHLDNHLRQFDT